MPPPKKKENKEKGKYVFSAVEEGMPLVQNLAPISQPNAFFGINQKLN